MNNTLCRRLVLTCLLSLAGAASAATPSPEGQRYTPGSFEQLELDGAAQIRLVQGESDQVFISGDADVQRGVELEVTRNRLRISTTGGWKFWNGGKPQIEVQMRRLNRLSLSGASDLHAAGPIKGEQLTISISGSGQARFDDLKVENLRFDISGAGDGQLAGQVDQLQLSVSGKGKVQAEQLRAERATVSISGVGNASVWATDTLRVVVSGVGTVDYWGEPVVKRSVSGVGTITARGEKRR
jgi:hypothetical protein